MRKKAAKASLIRTLCNIRGANRLRVPRQAWDTLTWFAALIGMASYLNKFGFIKWFSDQARLPERPRHRGLEVLASKRVCIRVSAVKAPAHVQVELTGRRDAPKYQART